MALISCPECGKNVSTLAQFCPNCGYPIGTDFGNPKESKISSVDQIVVDERPQSELKNIFKPDRKQLVKGVKFDTASRLFKVGLLGKIYSFDSIIDVRVEKEFVSAKQAKRIFGEEKKRSFLDVLVGKNVSNEVLMSLQIIISVATANRPKDIPIIQQVSGVIHRDTPECNDVIKKANKMCDTIKNIIR